MGGILGIHWLGETYFCASNASTARSPHFEKHSNCAFWICVTKPLVFNITPESPTPVLSLTYSLADQDFATTKSVGIFNLSVQLLKALTGLPGGLDLEVLINSGLSERVVLPAGIAMR